MFLMRQQVGPSKAKFDPVHCTTTWGSGGVTPPTFS